jgi:mycofactocin glycosyltransferase
VVGPAQLGRRPDEPFPHGTWVDLAPDVRWLAPTVLAGGMPPRLLRLTRRGAELASAFGAAPVSEGASARLARTLTDAGIAVPRPARLRPPVDLTVVVPVRDRPVELGGCLASLGSRHRVVVVDDGSADRGAVEEICRRHGAEVVRRDASGGPAAARNTGLRMVTSDLVAFVDSDCLPPPDWIEALAAHFADPLVVGAAPRIVPAPRGRGTSLVDLGSRPAAVHPRSSVPYLPAAAVVFRRAALGDGFDESLRYGEDVDLVWRLVEAGWRIRYVPDVEVGHRDPTAVAQRMRRRFMYGTSVGPLERAHPGRIDHLVVGFGPACAVAGFIVGSPPLAAAAWAATAVHVERRLRPLTLGRGYALRLSAAQVVHAWTGLGRWCITFGVPLLAGSVLARHARPARRTRLILALLAGSALLARRVGPDGGHRRVLVDDCLGEMAYGLGVATGCVRAGVVRPLLPRVAWRRWDAPRTPLRGKGVD